ncbi:MAG: class I SAM-dependent methyltransferase [Anaerolineae bacterium]|nr:class I SAM-dependent methyltransferase [Anaerolineae bacterium]
MVKLDKHYVDPRLVALYDIENPRGEDTDFYLNFANKINAKQIVDLGCGTGILTRELALSGREVIGVDPASAMLAVAQQHPDADRVQWINGDASVLGNRQADLVLMTGNVAQVFLEIDDWLTTLTNIFNSLRPGGYLAFESRNPLVKAWQQWNRDESYYEFDSPHGRMASWVAVVDVHDNRVQLEGHNLFLETGEVIVAESELVFRSREEIAAQLTQIGFTVERVYGDWHQTTFDDTERLMVFIACRPL